MVQGWFESGVCYSNYSYAVDAHFQAMQPYVVTSAGTGFVFIPKLNLNGSWYLEKSNINGVVSNTLLVDPVFRSCEAVGGFDYAYASALWTLSFTFVVGLYFVTKGYGTILNFIKGHH